MTTLCILFDGLDVGVARSEGDRFGLVYDEGWQRLHFAFSVSVSLPLTRKEWSAEEAHHYFANLLPEGLSRQAVCSKLGVSIDNDVALLRALGNDTAGAFRFVDAEQPVVERDRTPIAPERLSRWAAGEPALLDDEPVRLSLAGAQHKTSAVRDGDGWSIPASGEASTHILKFDSERFKNLSVNEFYVTSLASNLGLDVVSADLDTTTPTPFLVVQRYDRERTADGVERRHQEDFCQALGYSPNTKYEDEGGPRLAEVASVLRDVSAAPARDLSRLVGWVVFCALAGNADGHAKNLSMLYSGRRVELAPFYDLVSTRAFPNVTHSLAFAVGGVRDPDKIDRAAWGRAAADLGVSERLVVREVERQLAALDDALDSADESTQQRVPQSDVPGVIRHLVGKRVRAIERGLV